MVVVVTVKLCCDVNVLDSVISDDAVRDLVSVQSLDAEIVFDGENDLVTVRVTVTVIVLVRVGLSMLRDVVLDSVAVTEYVRLSLIVSGYEKDNVGDSEGVKVAELVRDGVSTVALDSEVRVTEDVITLERLSLCVGEIKSVRDGLRVELLENDN